MHSSVFVIYDSISQASETKWSQIVLGWGGGEGVGQLDVLLTLLLLIQFTTPRASLKARALLDGF